MGGSTVRRCARWGVLWAVLITFVAPLASWAQDPHQYLGKEMRLLEWQADDASTTLPDLMASGSEVCDEVPTLNASLHLGSPIWHWFEVDLSRFEMQGQWLEVASSMCDSLVCIASCDGRELYRMEAHGSGKRWHQNGPWDGSNYPRFPLPDQNCGGFKVHLGVKSGKQMVLPVRMERPARLRSYSLGRDLFFAFYGGIMMVMLLYNLVLYFTVKDRSYLLYVLFLIGVSCSQLFLEGYQGALFGLDSSTWWGMRAVHLIGIFSGTTTILFVIRFLNLKRNAPRYLRLFQTFLWAYVVVVAVTATGRLNLGFLLINVVASAALLAVPAALEVRRGGQKSATFLLVAFTTFLIAVSVFALKEFGILPHNQWTKYAMPVGSIVEVVLLSIALADRINQLKKESSLAREEQLKVSQLNEKIVRDQNQVLESKVLERTEALESQRDSLEGALKELQVTQDQLVQSEKLASIGQLTAGIAHELNNPINFVSSSAQSLRRDFEDVSAVVEALDKLHGTEAELVLQVEALHKRLQEMDLAFTMKEIEELLTGIEDGAQRTAEIVKGLRIFSRMDGDAAIQANINELLESTMVILRSSLNGEASLVLDLSADDTEVSCQPGKLNQVFMNLINNAAQATQTRPREEREVSIRTRRIVEEGAAKVQVAIQDNGVGMDDETMAQIFDPFFTTKAVGEGTGLGLSIVKGILDDHHAALDIQSTLGQGSTFLITFPA
tara:strand:+ start:4762 stop:6933 length:2172 start_codon:yes stop_codon:yes gene_type:complete